MAATNGVITYHFWPPDPQTLTALNFPANIENFHPAFVITVGFLFLVLVLALLLFDVF